MGKKNKNKKSSISQKSTSSVSCNNFTSLEDEIVQHLQLLKEAGCLVIGLNAVLRGLEKKSFCVVILISRKATSAMYRALNMICKNEDVIFLQLQDISSITLTSKLPSSTAYGIKTSILAEQEKFPELVEKINSARNSRKFQKRRKTDSPGPSNENDCKKNDDYEDQNVASENQCVIRELNAFIHSMHDKPSTGYLSFDETRKPDLLDYKIKASENQCLTGELNTFIHPAHDKPSTGYLSMVEATKPDFLDYKIKSNEISFSIMNH